MTISELQQRLDESEDLEKARLMAMRDLNRRQQMERHIEASLTLQAQGICAFHEALRRPGLPQLRWTV